MIIRNALHEDLSQILSLVKQKVRFDEFGDLNPRRNYSIKSSVADSPG